MNNKICSPNAKINLGLNIISKREDGYHNLETIFYPIQIHDKLQFSLNHSDCDELKVEGIDLDCSVENNLVMKALKLMRQNFKHIPNLKVNLQKSIPIRSGLGGGSSNASFMLRMLNDQYNLGLNNSKLIQMASKLGADCPFFIENRPIYAEGIGEIFENIGLNLEGYYIVIVNPNILISTKEAFSYIIPKKPAQSLKDIVQKPIEEWKNIMINDFEESVFNKYPQIKQLKEVFYQNGAIYSQMSGTGSSVFGIFKEMIDLDTFRNKIRIENLQHISLWQIKL